MNTMNTLAGGAGILIAGFLKQDFGLGGVFAGTSVIVLVAGVLLLTGYSFFLNRDLARQAEPGTQRSSVITLKAH
jgi:hypothetical protein